MLGTWKDNCMTGEERTKLSFWYSKFLDNYSVNLNFSTIYSLQYCSHLTMYQASWYLKTNLPVCLFPHSNGIKIGPPCQELRGVSKLPRTLKHPVVVIQWFQSELHGSTKKNHQIWIRNPILRNRWKPIFKSLTPLPVCRCSTNGQRR